MNEENKNGIDEQSVDLKKQNHLEKSNTWIQNLGWILLFLFVGTIFGVFLSKYFWNYYLEEYINAKQLKHKGSNYSVLYIAPAMIFDAQPEQIVVPQKTQPKEEPVVEKEKPKKGK